MKVHVITPAEASARGLSPITYPFAPGEHHLLLGILRDFSLSPEREASVVEVGDAAEQTLEVWARPLAALQDPITS
jgi:hypothetical protein